MLLLYGLVERSFDLVAQKNTCTSSCNEYNDKRESVGRPSREFKIIAALVRLKPLGVTTICDCCFIFLLRSCSTFVHVQ